jgi:hypothetical protein
MQIQYLFTIIPSSSTNFSKLLAISLSQFCFGYIFISENSIVRDPSISPAFRVGTRVSEHRLHQRAVQTGHAGAVPLGHGRIQPIGLQFVLLFSKYIQILSKFKNLWRIHLNVEKCETNFV